MVAVLMVSCGWTSALGANNHGGDGPDEKILPRDIRELEFHDGKVGRARGSSPENECRAT